VADASLGEVLAGPECVHNAIAPGEPLPEEWGGGVNKWPWAIPLIAKNIATKPELADHFAPESPDFNLMIPDQIRVEIFLRHLKQWIADREHGHDTMPDFVMLRLPNDHTAGTRPGGPTPKSSVADNDLAVGRAVEAISHSAYWDDTAFFILEDDAQNGADHVDAHRTLGFVISPYMKRHLVDSTMYSTSSMLRTIELILGLKPMSQYDAAATPMFNAFQSTPDLRPYIALPARIDLEEKNTKSSWGEKASRTMDFSKEDAVDDLLLNKVIWQAVRGEDSPVPPPTRAGFVFTHDKSKPDDD
jgi:hypothetical protein